MAKKSFITLVKINFFILFTAINTVLLGLWTINYALFFGFSIGSLVSYFLIEINELGLYFILLKGKKSATILGTLKFLINMIIVAGIIIGIIFINKNYAFKNNIQTTPYDKPINFIAFTLGLSLIMVAIIVSLIVENILKKKRKG